MSTLGLAVMWRPVGRPALPGVSACTTAAWVGSRTQRWLRPDSESVFLKNLMRF
jgi:hypothetical protein